MSSTLALGCGGSSSSAPPPAAPTASASATPVASAPAAPAPSAEPAPAASAAASATPPTDTSVQDTEEASADLVQHHRHHHHGGVVRFIAMALDTLGVTPEQKATIDNIQATLRAKLEPSRAAEANLMGVLADGVAAGKIDKAKVDAAVSQVGSTSGQVHAAVVDALNQLHAALNEAQRAALVEKVEAHWQVYEQANEGSPAPEMHQQGHLEHMAQTLSLTPDQVDKIKATLKNEHEKPDHEKVAARIKAFGSAFESPTFDAKTLKAEGVDSRLSAWGARRMAHFITAVTPVLTPDQRTKLAEHLREHANPPDAHTAG